MAKSIECRYSKDCAEEGCFLIAQIEHQSRLGGTSTPEQVNETISFQNGPYWLENGWKSYTSDTEKKAPKLGCGQSKELSMEIATETQAKTLRRELL